MVMIQEIDKEAILVGDGYVMTTYLWLLERTIKNLSSIMVMTTRTLN